MWEGWEVRKGTHNQRTHPGGKTEGQELMWIGHLREDAVQRNGRSMTLCLLLKRNHQKISGFELRQLLSSIVIKRIRCLLFLIFFQIVSWLVICVWRPKGQRFKQVHPNESIKWFFSLHNYHKEKSVGHRLCSPLFWVPALTESILHVTARILGSPDKALHFMREHAITKCSEALRSQPPQQDSH